MKAVGSRLRKYARWAVAVAMAVPLVARASSGIVAPSGHLWIEGDSTLHKYRLDAKHFDVSFKEAGEPPAKDLETEVCGGRVAGMEVVVPVGALRSGEDGLDDNAQKALKETAHPNIVFRMDSYTAQPGDKGCHLKLQGRLTIAGVERPEVVDAEVTRTAAGLQVAGEAKLLMSDFKVEPPVLMLGVLKTDDHVVVKFEVAIQGK